MSIGVLEDLLDGIGPGVSPLSVEQYHQMIAAGIVHEDEPLELIDGILVRRDRADGKGEDMPQGERHSGVLGQLTELLTISCVPAGCHPRIQLPLPLPPIDEPEPDVCIVRGRARDYIGRYPDRTDVIAVIEVASSSLVYDRRTKQRLYAAASIPEYWIVNLQDNVVEVHRSPLPAEQRYADRVEHRSGESIDLTLADSATIRIAVENIL
jgi:Uma2 family endonuclease